MLKCNVCDIKLYSSSDHCVYLRVHEGDSYSGLKVNFSEASDKAAIKKSEVR